MPKTKTPPKRCRPPTPLPIDVPRREAHTELEARALLGGRSRKLIRKLVSEGRLTPLTLGEGARPILYARTEIERLLRDARARARAKNAATTSVAPPHQQRVRRPANDTGKPVASDNGEARRDR